MSRSLLLYAILLTAVLTNVNAGAPVVRFSPFGDPIVNGPVNPKALSSEMMMPCPIFTNEIHYENTGTDVGERIEIAGDVGTDLTGWSIYLYNGFDGTFYTSITMSGTIPASPSCVVGGRTLGFVTFDVLALTGFSFQNGAPDGWALVNGSTVVEFYSYEGTFTGTNGPAAGLNSADIGTSEPSTALVGSSIQRTGAATWVFNDGTNTFGNCNTTQYSPSCSANPSVNLSLNTQQGAEATTSVITVTASASAAVSGAQTVTLAVTGTGITAGDYNLSNTTITIPNGSSTGTVTFTVVNDVLVEGLETAVLTISNPSSGIVLGATVSQNIAIYDNDLTAGTSCLFFANEVHYQNLGTDLNERIEIAGDAGASLAGWSIVFYEGTTGAPYATANLSGTIPNVGTCVVGTRTIGTVVVDVVAATGFSFQNGGVGSPDGWALCLNSTAVEFLSYDGTFTGTSGPAAGLTSTNIGATEDPSNPSTNGSIQRTTASTWVVGASTNTFGACNTTQYAPCIAPVIATVPTSVSCNGGNNGAIAVTVTDGTPPYNVSWAGPASGNPAGNEIAASGGTYNITGLISGTYTVSVTDGAGQTATASVTVNQPPVIVPTTTQVNVLCNGNSTGSIDLTVTGGVPGYTYNWSNGPTTQDISGLAAGTYTVTVTDVNLCTKTTSVTITQPAALALTTTQVNVLCNGAATGSIDLTVNGGFGSYTYNWGAGQPTTQDRSGLAAGTYTVTVTDGNNCTSSTSVTITEAPAIVLTTTQVNIPCNGFATGSIDLTATGGVPGYTYAWSNGPSTQDISGLVAGTYTVTVTDGNSCTKTTSVTITQPPAIVPTTTQVNVLCNGNSTGSIDLTVNGGVPGYTYLWSNGPTTQDISGLAAGNYTVTVTDASGCTNSTSVTITQPAALVLTTTQVNVLCNGAATGSIDLTVNGGAGSYTYNWGTGQPTTQDRSGLVAGTYTVTVTDGNNCTSSTAVTITEAPAIVLSTTQVNVVCNGAATGSIDLTATGGVPGYTYAWSNGSLTQDISGLTAGTYTVTVTDVNLCTKTISATITQAPAIVLTTTQVNVLCNGAATGSIDLSVSNGVPGYTYAWSNGPTTEDISGLTAGTYTVTVTDANSCTNSTSVTITQPAAIVLTTTQVNVLCNGAATGSIDLTVTGGNGSYTYNWGAGQPTTQDRSGLVAGTYTVTVTDANNCTKSTSVTITEPSAIVLSTTQVNVLCNGAATGSIDLTVNGGLPGYTYAWSNGPSTQDISGLAAGTYTVTVTDANNCTKTTAVTITQLSAIALSTTQVNVLCNGAATGSIDLSVSGGTPGYTYAWSNGPSTQDISGLSAGTYTVTVTDANSCTKTISATIIQPAAIVLSTTQVNVLCNGAATGSIDLTATGGTGTLTYQWSSGPSTEDISGLAAGTYTVTVTDANGCTKTISATITEPSAIVLTTTQVNVLCNGAATGSIDLTVTGGTGSYTYNWGAGQPTTQDRSGLTAGTYTVTVTDANNCTKSTSVTITEQSAIVPTSTQVNVLCNGAATGSIDLSVTGGTGTYTYAWSNGPSTQDVSGLVAGTYTVTVTDGNLCTKTLSATISQPPAIVLSTTQVNVLCNGAATGSIDLTASGGTGTLTYQWSNGPTTQDISGLVAGTYTVTVTDANSCTKTISATISQPTAIVLSTTQVNVFCNGAATGAIDLTATGGTGTLTYQWSNGPATQDVSGLAAGTYTVTVTDANGCTKTTSATISQPSAIVLSATTTPACAGVNNGTIDLTVNGGVPGYTYQWSNGVITQDVSGLGAGTYTVTVTDDNGCTKTTSATVAQSSLINLSTTTTNTCTGTSVGAIDLTVSGGTPGYTYDWSNDGAENPDNDTQDLTNLSAGTYTVTVTDANTCTQTTSATVVANPVPTVNAVSNQAVCNGSATAAVTFSGTPAGVVFNWTNNTPSIGLAANGTGNIASFNATNTTAVPVVATITVTPSITGGGTTCLGTPITFTITVNPTPLAFAVTGGGVVCTTDNIGVPVGLSNSQVNVNYQLRLNGNNVGAPVAGTGAAISFGPQLPAGTYTVVATHTLGGCTTLMSGSVSVSTFNCTVAISDPCVCLNNATTLTNGQFGEQVKVNAPTSQTWTVTAVSGLYLTASPAPPAAPNPITVGTVLVNIGGNMFTLDGRHIDAIGYTITVSNGAGTSLSIGNSCQYPNPVITSDLTGPFCLYSDPVTLTGNPGDANIVSQGFTVNGVAATQFNPGAGVGQYTIVYTVNGGAPKASGANDPGCIQSVSQIVNVIATPSAIACNNNVQISLDEDCETEILPDMILEGTYGCFDDYKVELDKTTPLGNGPWVAPIVGVNDINKTYGAKVTHLVSGVSCWGTIKIEDKLAPVVICSTFNIACAETNYNPAYLSNVLGITAAYPTVTENCGTYTQTYTDQWFDLPCPPSPTQSAVTAYIIRTWVVTDASGNASTCSQTINILGSRVWDVNFPADVTISCGANVNTNPGSTGTPYITFSYPAQDVDYAIWPGSNYCELQSTYTDQILPVCDGTYKILRTWTVYDWCVPTSPFPPSNNPQYYVQVIKVVDETGPTFACPADMTVSTDPFNCCATTELPDIIMSDNCSRINHVDARVLVYDPYTGDLIATHDLAGWLTTFPGNNLWNPDTLANFGLTPCLPIGQHTVIYTATDDCGNHSTCSFELEVRDLTPPVTACDEWTQVALGVNGMAFVNAETFDDGSYDNCNDVFFKARRMNQNDCQPNTNFYDQVKFCCEDIGDTILVVLRVYDVDPGTGNVGLEDYEGHYNDCMVQALVEDKIKPVCTAPANVTVSCEAFDPSYWAYGQATATDNCCVDTITNTVVLSQFDSLCNKGTITRRWTAIDCAGNTSQCTQRIIVQYNQHYYVKFPADRLVSTCDGTGNYGAPEFYGEDCELLATSFNDEIFTVVPDACFKIERTWTVINWCTYNPNLPCIYVPNPNPSNTTNAPANLAGVTVSECGNTVLNWNPTVVKINPSDPTATNFCTFWSANANCYQYKQIIKVYDTQDPSVVTPTPGEYCDYSTNDGAFWNASYYWDATIASHDLCEGDANIELTATDACSGANISFRYLLFLDLDGDGTMETVVNSVNPPGFNNINYNNANTPNYAGGTPQQFDFRAVPFNQKWGFGLQTDAAVGNNRTARVRWFNQQGQNAVPQLPYGNHKIKWFIEDGCGNETIVETPINVKDCKKPTVVCLNGLSVNLMNTNPAMVQLWASDFLQYTEDNCTPANQLKIAIRRSGTGTGFPTNPDGTPQTGVTFDCNDLGTQLVELWSIDKAGNADFCETYVLIQDNMGVCGNNATVAGALLTDEAEGVQDATVELEGVTNGLPTLSTVFSQVTGDYAFSNALPIGSNYTVTPTMEIDPLNGVNTYDLILISRHILGLEPLNTPYKLISADANKSGTVTTFDVVELRKLILGTYQKLPNNSSWRFIDKTQVFNDPNNPFAEAIRENVSVLQVQQSQTGDDFIAAKIGDVDNTAIPNNLVATDDRTNGTLLFDVTDRKVKAGEEFTVTFKAAQQVKGYQFTLNLQNLEVVNIAPGQNMTAENFAVFSDAITTSADDTDGQFTVTFRAKANGTLSQMIGVSSRITKAVAFDQTAAKLEVAIRFNNGSTSTIAGLGFELYQNTPNPWVSKTQIGFHLPEATNARLTIYDAAGRTLYTQQGDFGKGYNAFTIDRKVVEAAAGNLFYKVETATDNGVKQMIQTK